MTTWTNNVRARGTAGTVQAAKNLADGCGLHIHAEPHGKGRRYDVHDDQTSEFYGFRMTGKALYRLVLQIATERGYQPRYVKIGVREYVQGAEKAKIEQIEQLVTEIVREHT
jgi:hypothetical protein